MAQVGIPLPFISRPVETNNTLRSVGACNTLKFFSFVSSCPYGHSFVPAESATLGIVDKSAFQHAICSDSDCATQFPDFYCPQFSPAFKPASRSLK